MKKNLELLQQHDIKITQCSDGNFIANIYIGGDYVSGRKQKGDDSTKRTTIRRSSEKAIVQYLVGLITEQENNPTVKEIFDVICRNRDGFDHIKTSTVQRNQRDFKRFFSTFGEKQIKDIDSQDIENFLIDSKRQYDLTAKCYNNLVGIVRNIFIEAYRQKLSNPSLNFEDAIKRASYTNCHFKKNLKTDLEEVYTRDETRVIMDFLKDGLLKSDDYRHHRSAIHDIGILLLFVSGLRIGELSALRWTDYSEIDNTIHVHCTETEVVIEGKRRTAISDTPKTDAGNRTIPVPSSYKDLFSIARKLNPDGEFIFEYNHKRIESRFFRERLKRVCKKINVTYRHPHAIRKSYATTLRESGVNEQMIISLLGHTNFEVTQKYYIKNRFSSECLRQSIDEICF